MKRFYLLLLNLFLCFFVTQNQALSIGLANSQKYKIQLPQSLIKDSCGLYPSVGSGIEFVKKLSDGSLEFFTVTDGGANIVMKEKKSVVAFCPSFSPKISKLIVTPNDEAKITSYVNISYEGNPITGFNMNSKHDSMLVVDDNMKSIKKTFGMDTENISILKDGNFIIGDEHYPSLNIVSKDGKIIRRLLPGDGLPEIVGFKGFNRGFEAVTVTPNGKVYAFLEGPIDINSETAKTAKLIRCFEIDMKKNTVKTYAYKFDYDSYEDGTKVKLGDAAAVDNTHILIVEQGSGKSGMRNVIYNLDLKGATDISNLKLANGKDLEYGAVEDLKNIKFIKKSFLIDPRKHGWKNEKLEGLTVINAKTIAITNDNDFGVIGSKDTPVKCSDGSVETKCSKILPEEDKASRETDLWILELDGNI